MVVSLSGRMSVNKAKSERLTDFPTDDLSNQIFHAEVLSIVLLLIKRKNVPGGSEIMALEDVGRCHGVKSCFCQALVSSFASREYGTAKCAKAD
jgi:hypothetical protein